jgi:hypothetical protein
MIERENHQHRDARVRGHDDASATITAGNASQERLAGP